MTIFSCKTFKNMNRDFNFSFHAYVSYIFLTGTKLIPVIMSSSKTRRSLVNTEEESEDLFVSPRRAKKPRILETEKENDTLQDDSLFGELISKAGYILKKGDQPNLLSMYKTVFFLITFV